MIHKMKGTPIHQLKKEKFIIHMLQILKKEEKNVFGTQQKI